MVGYHDDGAEEHCIDTSTDCVFKYVQTVFTLLRLTQYGHGVFIYSTMAVTDTPESLRGTAADPSAEDLKAARRRREKPQLSCNLCRERK